MSVATQTVPTTRGVATIARPEAASPTPQPSKVEADIATPPLPLLFVSHGSPMVLLDDDEFTRALRQVGEGLAAPRAVVVVSAHWRNPAPIRVTGHPVPPTVHDFGGFPEALYEIDYPCPGAPPLAADIASILADDGFPSAVEPARGLDHGAWVPLRLAYPDALVPAVEVSLLAGTGPAELWRIGRALAPLRERGVLLVGSGGIVHNLSRVVFDRKDAEVDPWAREFDAWVARRLEEGDFAALLEYQRAAPHADLAVPTSEHFDPLFVVLGAAAPGERVVLAHEGFQYGNLSMRSFLLERPGSSDARRLRTAG